MNGKINHLLRKHKHLRTCRARNTQALVRTFGRILDMPSNAPGSVAKTGPGGAAGSTAPSTAPAAECETLRVGSAAEAVVLLRGLTDSDLVKLLAAVEQRADERHSQNHPCTATTGTGTATGTAGNFKSIVRQQRGHEKHGVNEQQEEMSDVGRRGGISEERHRRLVADLESRAQQLRQACAQLADTRRHEAALYRWMPSCPLEAAKAYDASSDLDDLDVGSETNKEEARKQTTNHTTRDLVDLAMLRELDSAVEALVLADISHGACFTAAADLHRVLTTAETDINLALRAEGLPGASPQPHPHSYSHPHTHTPAPTRLHVHLQHLHREDHPLARLYRDRLPPPLPDVRLALDHLCATHLDVLHRTAQAFAPYAPYTCEFV